MQVVVAVLLKWTTDCKSTRVHENHKNCSPKFHDNHLTDQRHVDCYHENKITRSKEPIVLCPIHTIFVRSLKGIHENVEGMRAEVEMIEAALEPLTWIETEEEDW